MDSDRGKQKQLQEDDTAKDRPTNVENLPDDLREMRNGCGKRVFTEEIPWQEQVILWDARCESRTNTYRPVSKSITSGCHKARYVSNK